MIHTKLLIRRLAYVPWLLAFGLVLGWAGEAQAQQEVTLSGTGEVREDLGGTADVSVKVAVPADAADAIYVTLTIDNDALNTRLPHRASYARDCEGYERGDGDDQVHPHLTR